MTSVRACLPGFAALMAFDTLAQFCFKMAALAALPLSFDAAWLGRVLLAPWLYGAIAGYVGAFVTWMSLLRQAPIGPAFAASHLDIVSVMLVSAWLLGEPLDVPQLAGALAILAGIGCLAVSESREAAASGSLSTAR